LLDSIDRELFSKARVQCWAAIYVDAETGMDGTCIVVTPLEMQTVR